MCRMLDTLTVITGKKFAQNDVFEVVWEEPEESTQLTV